MKRSLHLPLFVVGFAAGSALAWFRLAEGSQRSAVAAVAGGSVSRPANLTSPGSSALVTAWRRAAGSKGGFGQRLAFMAMIARATSAEMPLLLAQCKTNLFARDLLLLRWVEIDPEAAGDWISPALRDPNAPGSEASAVEVARVLGAWAKRDPAAALAKISAEAGAYASTHQNKILGILLADDMERGLRVMAEAKLKPAWSSLDPSWVSKDPGKAARLLGEMPESDFRDDSLLWAMREVGAKDLAAGIALLEKYPNLSSARQQMWGVSDGRAPLFAEWAKQDMTGMIAFVNDRAQGPTRSAMKEAIGKVIGEGDPQVAFAWAADNLSGERRNNVVHSLLAKLAKEKPSEALDYLVSLPPGTALDNAVGAFANATRDEDARTALARIQSLPQGEVRTKLMGASLLAWYEKDPATALGEVIRQPPDSVPKDMWNMLGFSSKNIPETLKHLDQVPPERAPEFVGALFSSPASYNVGFSQKAKSIEELKDPGLRSQAIEGMLGNWAWRDRTAAVEWAATLPSAEERQQVRTILERNVGQLSAEERNKLAEPLEDKKPN